MCDFDHATIGSPSFHGLRSERLAHYLCIKYEQKCENVLQIMNLAAWASKGLITSFIIT